MVDNLLTIGMAHYLAVASALFVMGLLGALLRKNLVVILISIELMLVGSSLAMMTFSYYLNDERGGVAIILLTVISVIKNLFGLLLIYSVFSSANQIHVRYLEKVRGQ